MDIRLRHHPHFSFCLYVKIPATETRLLPQGGRLESPDLSAYTLSTPWISPHDPLGPFRLLFLTTIHTIHFASTTGSLLTEIRILPQGHGADTLDISSRLSGSLQVAFPHYLPLTARPPLTHILQPPQSTLLLHFSTTCNPPKPPLAHILAPAAAWPAGVPGIGYNWMARLLRTAAAGGVAPPGPGACDGPGICRMAPAAPLDSPAALGPLRPARSPAPP